MTRGRRLLRWCGARIDRPIRIDRLLFGLAAVGAAVALLIALVVIVRDRNYFEARLAERDAVADCRAALSTSVTDKETDLKIYQARLIVAVARREAAEATIRDLDLAAGELSVARDRRVDFERDPVVGADHPCPAEP